MSQSNSKTMTEVMNLALARTGKTIRQVSYVNAHATGTVQGDAEEALAIGAVCGSNTNDAARN